ncbi:hypothetical protein ACH4JZ_19065 [Streptomyces sp. NPDC017615]|uniref:hypothetical protein n=1 Tax=Streptomyces sp. NPDC017615 TaxID=3365003 RepID=UPI0037B88499
MSTSGEHGYPDTGQTRTHLPGGDPYGGAPRRTPRSPSRSLITVVGVVVLLIAAIAFANRDNSPASKGPAKGPDRAAAAPTAPSGTTPVPTTENGIPTNFPHTKQGAESAAANYAVALGSAEMFNKARRDSVLQTVMTPSRVTSSKAEMDQAYTSAFNQSLGLSAEGAAPNGSTFVSRTSPIGTKVTESGDDTATVAVWCSGLLGLAGSKSTNPVTNSWFTITMKLQWAAGDWKIITHSQTEGPAPVPGDDKASSADDMSKTVEEYGGFTYAR